MSAIKYIDMGINSGTFINSFIGSAMAVEPTTTISEIPLFTVVRFKY